MYRAITWAAIQASIKPTDKRRLGELAEELTINLVYHDSVDPAIIVNNDNVTPHLRDTLVEQNVSSVSQIAKVRNVLTDKQRQLASSGDMVVAGRDIGTVVLHDAATKLFLTASVQERARRRQAERIEDGTKLPLEVIQAELERRDKSDSQRKISPLRPAWNAQVIVTDGMSVEQVIQLILTIVKRRE